MTAKLRAAAIILAALALPARADDMTAADWARQAVFTGTMYADYRQTLNIFERQPEGYGERNPILRNHHWTPNGIRNYFIATTAAHAAITMAIPREYRPKWQMASIAFEAVVVGRNKALGLLIVF